MATRRQVFSNLASLACLASVRSHSQAAVSERDGRAAIVDTSLNVLPRVKDLKKNGVKAIGRYYARKAQPQLPEKRIAFNRNGRLSEAQVLLENGIGILSVYQYLNQLPEKFTSGLADTGSASAEATADALAAVEQAAIVGQSIGSSIYFGVDFDVKPDARTATGKPTIETILDYFRIVNQIVGAKFQVGAYGNGFVNRILREEKLINLSWVSPSRSFAETPLFISSGQWHLFQNQVNRRWFETDALCPSGLAVDTDIQNPNFIDIGVWGTPPISKARSQAIFDQRRFVTKTAKIISTPDANGEPIRKLRCILDLPTKSWKSIIENQIQRANNVRIIDVRGEWALIDIDEDGVADGFCLQGDLTPDFLTMPVL